MSEKDSTPAAPPPDAPVDLSPPGPETQSERWLKYGVNVVLTSVVVIVLAGIVVWATNKDRIPLGSKSISLKARKDVSGDTSNVLKPQTVQLIADLPGGDDKAITLVSLYPKLKKEEAAAKGADTYQRVQDILDEYRRSGKNIKVEAIDPVAEPGKLDAWLGEVKRRYGKNIENYEKFVKEFPKTLDEIKKLATPETDKLKALIGEYNQAGDKLTDEQVTVINRTLSPAYSTVASFPKLLEQLNDGAKAELEQKIPDYAGAVKVIKSGNGLMPGLTSLSRQCGALAAMFEKTKDEKDAPDSLKAYAKDAGARYLAIKGKADEALKKSDNLGELKLDDVRKKLVPAEGEAAPPPAIAVMGPDDVKVIDDFSLWKSGQTTGMTGGRGGPDDKPKLRFAGEQQLTSAILGLASTTKRRVVFVRGSGTPLTTSQMSFMGAEEGPLVEIATRLRSYNFEVLEKSFGGPDPTGRPPAGGDATDEQLKDAIWVVLGFPPEQQQPGMMGMPPPAAGQLGEKLKQHLDAGGSALCLLTPQGEDLSAALKDWGVDVRSDLVVVHERVQTTEAEPTDFVERARREPYIFILNRFGDHPLVKAVNSLDAALLPLIPVKKAAAVPAGTTVTEIIPIPEQPKSWGESDRDSVFGQQRRRGAATPLTFDPATDVPGPLFAGAVAEKQGKGRLVVIGCAQFAFNELLRWPDEKLEKAKTVVSRFPGNGELFTNSVFWLDKNEKMMALSPAAMDTARIAAIEPAKLNFIRYGLVLVTLPFLAVVAGLGVWFTRRG